MININKTIVLLFILTILFTLNVNALTLTLEKARVYAPDGQKLTIDFDKPKISPDFKDVYLKVEIFGSATFEDGSKFKEYSYNMMDENKILEETINLDVENPTVEETIMVKANMRYTMDLLGGFSKTNKPSKSIQFLGIWAESVKCQEQLRQCEDSEKILQEDSNQLKGEIGVLNGDVFSLTEEKNSLENKITDLEGQLNDCKTTKTNLEQRSPPENDCNRAMILGIGIPSGLLLVVLIVGGFVIWSLKKENDELKQGGPPPHNSHM